MQIIKFIFCFLFLLPSSLLLASEKEVSEFNVQDIKVDKNYLDSWSLSKEEYTRYLYIKKNTPRGYYTKDHPLFYLGIEARNDAEREKFAKLIAKMEFENFEKIQAFSKEIQRQSIAIYGKGKIMDFDSLKEDPIDEVINGKAEKFQLSSFLYVDKLCFTKCKNALDKEIIKLVKGELAQIHVIFPKDNTTKDINKWAYLNKVPVELNNRNVILLRSIRDGDDEKISIFPTVTSKLL